MAKSERQEWIEMIVAATVAAPGTGAMTHILIYREDRAGVFVLGLTPFADYWNGLTQRQQTRFLGECSKLIERERRSIAMTELSQRLFAEGMRKMGK